MYCLYLMFQLVMKKSYFKVGDIFLAVFSVIFSNDYKVILIIQVRVVSIKT